MPFGLPNEFCFTDLNKGGKVIGIICVCSTIICSIMLMIYLFSDYDSIKEELKDHYDIQRLNEHKTGAQTIAGIFLGVLILHAVASMFLIKGVNEKSKKLLIPFLIMSVATFVISLVVASFQLEDGPFYAVLTLSLILFYFFICVLSLYRKMVD